MRRRRIHILSRHQHLDSLDLWPGDTVWYDDFRTYGRVDDQGVLVLEKDIAVS